MALLRYREKVLWHQHLHGFLHDKPGHNQAGARAIEKSCFLMVASSHLREPLGNEGNLSYPPVLGPDHDPVVALSLCLCISVGADPTYLNWQ